MRNQLTTVENESGSVMVLVLMILLLLTLMIFAGIRTSSMDLDSATNDNLHKIAFYSAEAARAYVTMNANLYGTENVDSATPNLFPNNTDPYVPITTGSVAPFSLGNVQSFNGEVKYIGKGTPPRGSGYDTSKFRSLRYTMTCSGYAPRNTTVKIESGFYRIGF